MGKPFFTVAIPTFNRRKRLQRCLEFLLKQSFANFEIIVADNASTDDTSDYLRSISDSRVRHIRHQENRGAFQNLLFCGSVGEGEFLIIHQDDCLLHPDFLLHCHSCVTRNPEVAVFGAAMAAGNNTRGFTVNIFPPSGATSREEELYLLNGEPILIEGKDAAVWFLSSHFTNHPAIAFHRTALEAAGGYCSELDCYADLVTVPRIMLQGKVAYDARVGAISFMHGGNVSVNVSKRERAYRTHRTFCLQVDDLNRFVPGWPAILKSQLHDVNVKTLKIQFKDAVGFKAPNSLTRVFYDKFCRSYSSRGKQLKAFLSCMGLKNTIRLLWRIHTGIEPKSMAKP